MENKISKLITYANSKSLLDKRDNVYMYNQLCYLLDYQAEESFKSITTDEHIDDILNQLVDEYTQFETATEKELFKSKLIGSIIERPSQVEKTFYQYYQKSPLAATNYFHQFAKDVNYIKEREIAKNIVYKVDSEYGEIDITINLSKPEKSTKEIEMLKRTTSSNWPKCFLCKEQEGLYGSIKNPDRSNHRIVHVDLNDSEWFLQYSPFSYFNEHSILLSTNHQDMKINRIAFSNLIKFVEQFPHYMIGSNADLPIVGGSMLTHDHYQAGNYTFTLFNASSKKQKTIGNVAVHSVKWPLHTVKLISENTEELLNVAERVFDMWIAYEDIENNVYKQTDVRHNTITPIVRKVDNNFEMYLILRNNYTTDEHPTGIYHVDKSRHHIKQENIGLIEAMGLAVLPARLKTELEQIASSSKRLPEMEKHSRLYDELEANKPENRKQFLYEIVGKIFVECLEDCGVFKYQPEKYFEFIQNLSE